MGTLNLFLMKLILKKNDSLNLVNQYIENLDKKKSCKLIAYSNELVQNYNKKIRNILFPNNDNLVQGDILLVVKNNYHHEIDILNGTFCEVAFVEENIECREVPINTGLDFHGKRKNLKIKLRFQDIVIEFQGIGTKIEINCKIILNNLNNIARELSSEENKALYLDFRNRNPLLKPIDPLFKDQLNSDPYFNALQVKYGYAVTCHKAQGGEWENIFIDFKDRNKLNKESLRWSYTAITRASENVMVTNCYESNPLKPKKGKPHIEFDPNVLNISNNNKSEEINLPDHLKNYSNIVKSAYRHLVGCVQELIDVVEVEKVAEYQIMFRLKKENKTGNITINYKKTSIISTITPNNFKRYRI